MQFLPFVFFGQECLIVIIWSVHIMDGCLAFILHLNYFSCPELLIDRVFPTFILTIFSIYVCICSFLWYIFEEPRIYYKIKSWSKAYISNDLYALVSLDLITHLSFTSLSNIYVCRFATWSWIYSQLVN